ncbi:EF-hand domain-containing protein [Methylobacterium aerolatum]|uniref:Ca2+-binding EF-hand superfamily protein n=1 Tax=Methylobacterium aerolatum TaxID=418708 RepID=A0ABU0I4C6_9HYPH|nr:EF-hand domain-containing protein [Methylobacterium aerolatum]MDQ0449461.1 Ca2+-binding EF-hand superfamily protein [Methylobacterium aerolatum]GJD33492.1 hypothetical protein FMGBMHLM_0379 [Methylobacterium aerolatum]
MIGQTRTRTLLAALLVTAVALPATLPQPAAARSGGAAKSLKAIDTDNDGTIDLAEAQAAGKATFERLDTDRDGSVDTKELQGRISKKEMKMADPDNDKSVDQKEYDALVAERFKAADPDGDGKLDAKELKTPAGRSLLRLLK